MVDLDERRLLPRYRQGDGRAYEELVGRYRAPVYGYLVRCGVDPASRDDLFQEIFFKVAAAAATYRSDRPLRPWIFTIVANTVRSYFRRLRVDRLVYGDREEGRPAQSGSPEALAVARQSLRWLQRAIGELPLAQREVLLLSCVVGLDTAEVASACDIPVNTVKTHRRRARLALLRAMARREATARREAGR